MPAPLPSDVPNLWKVDGSLRDIYILGTTKKCWEKFIGLTAAYPHTYSFDGQACSLPHIREIFSNRSGSHLFSIAVGSVRLNCHFFVESEIELDIDPREVKGQEEHFQVLRFVEDLAIRVGRPALVTPENGEIIPFLSYEPSSMRWSIYD